MKHSILVVALLAACADSIEPSSDASVDEVDEIESASSVVQCRWLQRHGGFTELPCGSCIKLDTWKAGRAWVGYHENCYICSALVPGTTNTWREVSASCLPRYPVSTGCSAC